MHEDIRQEMSKACPKCGEKIWDGPRYVASDPQTGECLRIRCATCQFVRSIPCLDVTERLKG